MESPSKPSLIDRIAALLLREPEDREDLLALLHAALDRDLLDADALSKEQMVRRRDHLTAFFVAALKP